MSVVNTIVIGAGGHGSEICSYLYDANITLLGLIDTGKPIDVWQKSRILGGIAELRELAFQRTNEEFRYITAFGDNSTRALMVEKIEKLRLANVKAWTLVHSTASVGQGSVLGKGTLLAPNTIVTTNVTIGDHCILNVKASVSHDCVIGAYSNLNPNCTISGNCELGESVYIGAGATLIQKVKIGRGAVVGAGAVVIRDVPEFTTVVGVPAREISRAKPSKVKGGT